MNNWKNRKAYARWRLMHIRCTDPRNKNYPRYGGRGIAVCPRWHDFYAYLEDVGEPPFAGATLDRIQNNGNYELGNVKWATKREQALNREGQRATIWVWICGQKMCLKEAAARTGINKNTIKRALGIMPTPSREFMDRKNARRRKAS